MMNIFSNNKLVMAAAAVIIAVAIWYGFSGSSSSSTVLGTEGATGAVSAEDQDIVQTLLILRSVDLSGTIFSSNVFRGLQDFSTEITQEPVGRADPFAPLSASVRAGAASSVTADKSSSLFNPVN